MASAHKEVGTEAELARCCIYRRGSCVSPCDCLKIILKLESGQLNKKIFEVDFLFSLSKSSEEQVIISNYMVTYARWNGSVILVYLYFEFHVSSR